MPIPDSWTDAQVAAFITESDRKIDAWAGRVVAPGEVIIHDGLEFTKSTPEMVAQRSCVFCPIRNACHNAGPAPSVQRVAPQPRPQPHPAKARPMPQRETPIYAVLEQREAAAPNAPSDDTCQNPAAWSLIDDVRERLGMKRLGKEMGKPGDKRGTVALAFVNGRPRFGVNTGTLPEASAVKDLARLAKLALERDDAGREFFHAETIALARASKLAKDSVPEVLTMYVDREPCNFCQKTIPEVLKLVGVGQLTICFKDGTSTTLGAAP
jgi:hypothetical protein